MIEATGTCAGIENYSRYLSGRKKGEAPPTLYEYLPKDALVFVDESHVSLPQIRGMYRGDRSRKETLTEYGFRLPSALDNRPLRFDEWEILSGQKIFVSATPGKWEKEYSDNQVELLVRPTGLIDPEVELKPANSLISNKYLDDIFNKPINSWHIYKLFNATGMFSGAITFNQPLDNWDVTSISRMDNMFNEASLFDQDISCWCVSHDPLRTGFSDSSPIHSKSNFLPRWAQPCSPI